MAQEQPTNINLPPLSAISAHIDGEAKVTRPSYSGGFGINAFKKQLGILYTLAEKVIIDSDRGISLAQHPEFFNASGRLLRIQKEVDLHFVLPEALKNEEQDLTMQLNRIGRQFIGMSFTEIQLAEAVVHKGMRVEPKKNIETVLPRSLSPKEQTEEDQLAALAPLGETIPMNAARRHGYQSTEVEVKQFARLLEVYGERLTSEMLTLQQQQITEMLRAIHDGTIFGESSETRYKISKGTYSIIRFLSKWFPDGSVQFDNLHALNLPPKAK